MSSSNILTTESAYLNLNASSQNISGEKHFKNSVLFPQEGINADLRRSMQNMNHLNLSYNPILVLKSHLDSVRSLYITPDKKSLVSVGEDYLINFWDFKKCLRQPKENLEPYLTVRSHTTPIFTLTGPKNETNPICVYSSGIDGVIRSTRIPSSFCSKLNTIDDTDSSLLPWRAHQDMIWQLEYHAKESLISSVSADGTVKIFKAYEESNTDRLCN